MLYNYPVQDPDLTGTWPDTGRAGMIKLYLLLTKCIGLGGKSQILPGILFSQINEPKY